MPVDWKKKESYERLLAAWFAAMPEAKPDYRRIATFFGEGATYDAIEGRFRIIKKEAADLRKRVESGEQPEAPTRGSVVGTPKKNRSPRKNSSQDSKYVLDGRVTKSVNSTPTKKRNASQVKREYMNNSSFADLSFLTENESAESFDTDHASLGLNLSHSSDNYLASFDNNFWDNNTA